MMSLATFGLVGAVCPFVNRQRPPEQRLGQRLPARVSEQDR